MPWTSRLSATVANFFHTYSCCALLSALVANSSSWIPLALTNKFAEADEVDAPSVHQRFKQRFPAILVEFDVELRRHLIRQVE